MCFSTRQTSDEKLRHILRLFSPTHLKKTSSEISELRRNRRSTWAEWKLRLFAPKDPLTVPLCGFGWRWSLAERRTRPEVNLRHINLWTDLVLKPSTRHLRKWHLLLTKQHEASLQSVLQSEVKSSAECKAPVRSCWLIKREINFSFLRICWCGFHSGNSVGGRRSQSDDVTSVLLFHNVFYVSQWKDGS